MKKIALSEYEANLNRSFLTKINHTIPIGEEKEFGFASTFGVFLIYDHTKGRSAVIEVHTSQNDSNYWGIVHNPSELIQLSQEPTGSETLQIFRKMMGGPFFIKNTSTVRAKIVTLIHVGF